MSDVEQCPRCELRFARETELVWHLAHDHDEGAQQLAEELAETAADRRRWARRQRRLGPWWSRPRWS